MSFSCRARAVLPRIIGALLAVSLLASCSAVRIGYNNLATISYWWLDSFADFDEAQTQRLRTELAALHDWHRSGELPAYAALLHRMRSLAGGPVSASQVCQLAEQVRGHAQRLGERSARRLAAVVPTLRPEQLRHMAQQFEKRDRTWREKWLDVSPAKRNAQRLEQAEEWAEMVYGRLEEPKLALLRQGIASSSFDARLSWRERQRRQQDILQVFGEHSGNKDRPAHVQAEMLALVERSLHSPDPAYRHTLDQRLAENCRTVAALHNSTSAAQRRHAAETLRNYEDDLRALSAQR